jgi:hypothetical protein
MSLSVKLDRRRKDSIEGFLASVLLEEGMKVTFQEALGLMVDYSLENKQEILKRLRRLSALADDRAWKALRHADDWGVDDASQKIDVYIYGAN